MTVKELIEDLSKIASELTVVFNRAEDFAWENMEEVGGMGIHETTYINDEGKYCDKKKCLVIYT